VTDTILAGSARAQVGAHALLQGRDRDLHHLRDRLPAAAGKVFGQRDVRPLHGTEHRGVALAQHAARG